MTLVYVAPCAVPYVLKSTQGFIPVALYDPGTVIMEGEIGTNGREKFIVLKPGVFTIEDGLIILPSRSTVTLTRPRPLE